MRKAKRTVVFPALLAFAALVLPAGADEHECKAVLAAELEMQEPIEDRTRLQFDVDVTTGEACAEVTFDLILHESNSRGHYNRVRLVREVQVHDGSLTEQVVHELPSGHRYLGHDVELVACTRCPT